MSIDLKNTLSMNYMSMIRSNSAQGERGTIVALDSKNKVGVEQGTINPHLFHLDSREIAEYSLGFLDNSKTDISIFPLVMLGDSTLSFNLYIGDNSSFIKSVVSSFYTQSEFIFKLRDPSNTYILREARNGETEEVSEIIVSPNKTFNLYVLPDKTVVGHVIDRPYLQVPGQGGNLYSATYREYIPIGDFKVFHAVGVHESNGLITRYLDVFNYGEIDGVWELVKPSDLTPIPYFPSPIVFGRKFLGIPSDQTFSQTTELTNATTSPQDSIMEIFLESSSKTYPTGTPTQREWGESVVLRKISDGDSTSWKTLFLSDYVREAYINGLLSKPFILNEEVYLSYPPNNEFPRVDVHNEIVDQLKDTGWKIMDGSPLPNYAIDQIRYGDKGSTPEEYNETTTGISILGGSGYLIRVDVSTLTPVLGDSLTITPEGNLLLGIQEETPLVINLKIEGENISTTPAQMVVKLVSIDSSNNMVEIGQNQSFTINQGGISNQVPNIVFNYTVPANDPNFFNKGFNFFVSIGGFSTNISGCSMNIKMNKPNRPKVTLSVGDMRGRVSSGMDLVGVINPDNKNLYPGMTQEDAMQDHYHTIPAGQEKTSRSAQNEDMLNPYGSRNTSGVKGARVSTETRSKNNKKLILKRISKGGEVVLKKSWW